MSSASALPAGSFEIGGDLWVGRLGFGAMRIMGKTGVPTDVERRLAHAVLRRAVESGVTLIDTAPLYGVSEDLVGEAFPTYPDGVHVATKVGIVSTPGGLVHRGRPEQIREDCERSLRRLHVDVIALSQLHTVDPDVPIEESVGGMADLQHEGKVRHLGLSNVDLGQLRRAQVVAPVASVQNRFSLSEAFVHQRARDLRGRGDRLPAVAAARPRRSHRGRRRRLVSAAARLGATRRQVALAWVLGRAPVVCAIPGTGNLAHLAENMASAGLTLSLAERTALDHAATP